MGMLRCGFWLVGALLLSASGFGVDFPYDEDGRPLDRIVALVEDDVVVESELQREARKIASTIRQSGGTLPSAAVIREQALEQLILAKLQLAAAAKLGIEADEATVTQAVASIANNNNISVPEMEQMLRTEGMTMDEFRADLHDQIVLTQLRNKEILSRVEVTDSEIDSWLANNAAESAGRSEYQLFHILVATPEGASVEQIAGAEAKAQRLVGELRNGADFETLAQNESDGQNALSGGSLGWLKANQVPSLFIDQVRNLPRDGIAGPLRSSSGFHIIKLADFRGGERELVRQTHLRHILIRAGEQTSEEDALQRLEQLRTRIEGGDDFGALARSHSDDRATSLKGGDLGWVTDNDLPLEIAQAAAKLNPGQVSPPVRTLAGWHLVEVLDRRDYDNTDEARRNAAKEAIRKRKAKDAAEVFLRRLRSEAFVEIKLNNDV